MILLCSRWAVYTCNKHGETENRFQSSTVTDRRGWKKPRFLRKSCQVFKVFTARQHSSMQSAVLAMIDSTDRPSVTVRYHAKTTPATIMRSSLEDSPMILVSWRLTSARNSKGNEGAEWERGIRAFDWCQNHRPWMTLNDLERPKRNVVKKRCVFWSSLHKFEWR